MNTRHQSRTPEQVHSGGLRRGSTLLMVITAMSACLILSGAFVSARSNGAAIGANLRAANQARVEAESALAITLAALSSSELWRTNHVNGTLFERNHDDVEVRAQLVDLATGGAPDSSSVDIRATIRATVGDIERVAEADLFVALPDQSNSIDIDLGEFALFAGASITVRSEAIVQPWNSSPAIARGDPIRVATANGTSGAISVIDSAAIVDGVEFRPEGTSFHSGDLPISGIPDNVAVPAPAPPQELSNAVVMTEQTGYITVDTRTDSLELAGGDVLELLSGASLLVEGDFTMMNGAILKIDGNSSLVVYGDVSITNARIEVPETAQFNLYVGGDFVCGDAAITEPLGTAESWVAQLDRVRFLSLATRETIPTWRFRGRSIIKGECYAPGVDIRLQGEAVLIGRIAAQTILIEGHACLLYEPALDDRNGYTATDERAYDEQGRLPEAIEQLEDLSEANLAAASEALDLPLSASDTYVEPPNEDDSVSERRASQRHRRDRFNRGARHRYGNQFYRTQHVPIYGSRIRFIGLELTSHRVSR